MLQCTANIPVLQCTAYIHVPECTAYITVPKVAGIFSLSIDEHALHLWVVRCSDVTWRGWCCGGDVTWRCHHEVVMTCIHATRRQTIEQRSPDLSSARSNTNATTARSDTIGTSARSEINATVPRSDIYATAVRSDINATAAHSDINATAARIDINATSSRKLDYCTWLGEPRGVGTYYCTWLGNLAGWGQTTAHGWGTSRAGADYCTWLGEPRAVWIDRPLHGIVGIFIAMQNTNKLLRLVFVSTLLCKSWYESDYRIIITNSRVASVVHKNLTIVFLYNIIFLID